MTDFDLDDLPVRRRTLMKGAAWSVPVIAAAVAAPAHAASTPAGCPTCFDEGPMSWRMGPAVSNGVAKVNMIGGELIDGGPGGFHIDTVSCQQTGIYTTYPTSVTLTMSDGAIYAGTTAGIALGTFGTRQFGLPQSFDFVDIAFPDGTYSSGSAPVEPSKLVITADVEYSESGQSRRCPIILAWDLNATVETSTVITHGAGSVVFKGVGGDATP